MEQSLLNIEQQIDDKATDTGLENQSFFNTLKEPDTKQSIISTKFIMQRMLRVE